MDETLRRRVRSYLGRHPDDRRFSERLLELLDRIERDLDADERKRLLVLAQDAFERHLETKDHTLRARAGIAELRVDLQRLLSRLEWLTAARRGDQQLH